MAAPAAKTFVLVHGAWHGGWCWRRVSDLLERQGHKVFTPTLTGLGERIAPDAQGASDVATHVTDVVNLMKWEGLADVVLCGHSYGGMVVSGVAEQMAGKIGSIVFLDAFVPDNGEAISRPHRRRDFGSAPRRASARATSASRRARRRRSSSTRRTAPGSTRCACRSRSAHSSTR